MLDFFAEVVRKVLVTHSALDRGAGQIVLLLVHGKLGFAHPFSVFVFVLFLLFPQQVLVRGRDRDLCLHLKHLVLHIENHLFQHFLRIFRAIDQIVQVCANQCGNAFQ